MWSDTCIQPSPKPRIVPEYSSPTSVFFSWENVELILQKSPALAHKLVRLPFLRSQDSGDVRMFPTRFFFQVRANSGILVLSTTNEAGLAFENPVEGRAFAALLDCGKGIRSRGVAAIFLGTDRFFKPRSITVLRVMSKLVFR